MAKFETLLSPIQIGGITLRSRTIQSGMVSNLSNEDGTLADREIAYHVERANNGVGLQFVGAAYVTQQAKAYRYQLAIDTDTCIEPFKRLTGAVHAAGGNIGIQLWHGGSSANPMFSGMETVSASAVPSMYGIVPHELTKDEIKIIVGEFADAAERAKKAGFDIVEIHGTHGYLIDQFYSPFTNFRQDEYGASLENRCRFAIEVACAVRERVGKDFLISFRITGDEMNGQEGRNSVPEAIYLARRLVDEAGVQLINVSCCGLATTATSDMPDALLADIAAVIRVALHNKAMVSVADKIKRPEVAEAVLSNGKSDLVTMGRALLCDPQFLTKASEGREDEIRCCTSCNYCIAAMMEGNRAACMQNPLMGKEIDYDMSRKAEKAKKIIVVGGGPSGLQAAVVAAQRGHDVTLYEAGSILGGKLNVADKPPFKAEIHNVIAALTQAAEKAGVRIVLNNHMDAEAILAQAPDAVVVSTGAVPVKLHVPGMEQENVVFAEDVLTGKAQTGRNVVIVGGGTVGIECADYLIDKGRRVTIVEMNLAVMMDLMMIQQVPYMMRVFPKVSGILKCTRVLGVKGSDVITDNRTIKFVDTVVLAAGYRSVNTLAEQLKDNGMEVVVTGDAITPGKVFEATHTAFDIAYRL